jgi:plastocyanin
MKGTPAGSAVICQFYRSLKNIAFMSLVAVLVLRTTACDSSEQTVHIVAQDFLFTPAEVHVSAERPIRLRIVNEGREPHEFKSALLAHQTKLTGGPSSSLPVLPNHTAEAVIRTIPGVYLFYCAIRGHAGMSGTIIVE